MCLEQVSEFKYLGCVLDESGIYEGECNRKVASGRRIAGAIRSLVNARSLQLQCKRVLLVLALRYGSETMIWREKERSRVRAVQMANLRGLLGIRRMHKVPNVQIRQLYGVKKGVNKKIDEGVLRWFSHVKRMDNDTVSMRVYLGKCAGSRSVGRPLKRWIDTMKNCLKKRGLDVRQSR